MKDCFSAVKRDLLCGKKVLFSGTGCQVAGLKAFLGDQNDGLITIDIICHGVPSPMIWQSFLEWMERKYGGKISSVNFRDKRYGWMAHFETVVTKGKTRVADYYRAMFYQQYSLRSSCYECPFANMDRAGDITIADAWGVDIHNSDFNDDKGCSLEIINTDVGKQLFSDTRNDIQVREVSMGDFMQPNLKAPSIRPKNREEFRVDFYRNGFEYISRRYGMNTRKGNLVSILKRVLGRTGMTKVAKGVLRI